MKGSLILSFVLLLQLNYAQSNAKLDKLIALSLEYENKGELDNAIATHMKIMKLKPDSYQSANSIAGLYGKLQKFTDEIIWAQKAIAIKPDYALAYINLGNAYVGTGNFDKAAEYYKQAEKHDPASPLPPYSLGVIEEYKRNYPAAITYYEQSVSRDSTFQDGYFNLAAAYANVKEFSKASASIQKVLQLNPNDKEAREMFEHIIEEILQGH